MSGTGKAWLKWRNRVRREEVMVHSGSHSRPGIGLLHPEDEQPRRDQRTHPPIQTNPVWDFFPMLADIGNRSVEANLPSVAESAIDSVKSIALKCSDKPIQSWRSAPRVAAYISRIGIVAQKMGAQQVLSASVKALKEIDQKHLAKQRELRPNAEAYEVGVINEISELAEDLRRQDPLMRLHWPSDTAPSIIDGTWKPPAIRAVK